MDTALAAETLGLVGTLAGIAIALFALPIGVIVAACSVFAGCTTALVYALVAALNHYLQVKDKYEVIKTYGTKL